MKRWPAPRSAVWLGAVLVVALDQWTKEWALGALEPGQKRPLLGDLLSLQLTRNSGAALSLGRDHTWLLTIVALIVTIGIVVYAGRARTRLAIALTGIALGGAIGNLIDRIFREPSFGQGHVVDMINYNGYFIGNVADIAIVGAAAAFLVFSVVARPVLVGEQAELEADADAEESKDAADAPAAKKAAAAKTSAPAKNAAPGTKTAPAGKATPAKKAAPAEPTPAKARVRQARAASAADTPADEREP